MRFLSVPIAQAVGKETPSYEQIAAELREERARRGLALQKEHPVFRLAPTEALGTLMMAMIFREGVTEEHVKQVSDKMVEWAGESQEKQSALKRYCQDVLNGNFDINRYATEALREMSAEGSD